MRGCPPHPERHLSRHLAAALGATTASLDTLRHIPDLFTAFGAGLAHLGADGTGSLVLLNPEFHEVGAGTTDFGAGEHQAQMPRLHMPATDFQAMMAGHGHAFAVAAQALLDALLQLLVHMVHDVLLEGLTSAQRAFPCTVPIVSGCST